MGLQEIVLLIYFFSQLSLNLPLRGKPSDDNICSVLIVSKNFLKKKGGYF